VHEARRLSLGAGGLCQGTGADGGVVWSCDPNPSGTTDDVLRVNLRSGKAGRYEVGKRPDQGNLAVAAGRVWVITDAGLVGLSGRLVSPIRPSTWECPELTSPPQTSGLRTEPRRGGRCLG
jgi:hypothetical protein